VGAVGESVWSQAIPRECSCRRSYQVVLILSPSYSLISFPISFRELKQLEQEDVANGAFVMINQEEEVFSKKGSLLLPKDVVKTTDQIKTFVSEEQIKQLLCDELQTAVQRIQLLIPEETRKSRRPSGPESSTGGRAPGASKHLVTLTELSPDVNNLVERLELCLNHGYIGGVNNSKRMSFWDSVVRPMIPLYVQENVLSY